jgi:electron-transferring-flavoprotein dehydrogenase
MKSGMLAAEAVVDSFSSNGGAERGVQVEAYEDAIYNSWIAAELREVRNSHASFKWGVLPGMVHTAFSCFISGTYPMCNSLVAAVITHGLCM